MKTKGWALLAAILGTLLTVSGCQTPLQGMTEDDVYYSPRAAYGIPLYLSPFRGRVDVSERCNAAGGSTTFWDEHGRFFRIDYLKIDEHPMAQAPRFASDQTLLNAVMNNYLREILPTATAVEDADTSVREFLRDREPRALFVILNLNVDTQRVTERRDPLIRGTYYYGFLVFKRGEFIYVAQHYQQALMRDKMLQALNRLADHMIVPGKVRSETEIERAKVRWRTTAASIRFSDKPAESEDTVVTINPVRPCD
ncbi:MAG: hypothetical protein ACLGHG_01555 [Gammaproteobacteria bacterium]